MLQLPATVPSKGPVFLYGIWMAAAKIVCLIFIPFRLSQISCFTLNLSCFSSVPNNCPMLGLNSCFISPPAEGRSNPMNSPLFPPTSFVLLSFAWLYTFFSGGHVLLSTLAWCSASSSVSEGVLLMYPWIDVLHILLLLHHLVLPTQYRLSISSLFSHGRLYLSKNYPFLQYYSTYAYLDSLKYSSLA